MLQTETTYYVGFSARSEGQLTQARSAGLCACVQSVAAS